VRPQTHAEPSPRATRVAVQFDYQGKRVRPAARATAELNPPLSAEPEDQGSAIKQAIIRWLDSK
jgi:hypothetical protein